MPRLCVALARHMTRSRFPFRTMTYRQALSIAPLSVYLKIGFPVVSRRAVHVAAPVVKSGMHTAVGYPVRVS